MIRLVIFFVAVAAIAFGMSWLADRPGQIFVNWQGRELEISVFHAVIALAVLLGVVVLLWSILRQLVASPAAISGIFRRRQQKRGIDALSTGIIAVGAGDQELATRYAAQARRALPHEPLTDLLRAQAAQLRGDGAMARRIYESMLAAPDTELLGLRGLFLEAMQQEETEVARQFAERAVKLNPKLDWSANALFELQCKDEDWAGALDSLAVARKHGNVDKATAARRRAVLLTAQAQEAEEGDMDRALQLSLEGHKLADGLVPAAEIAGRLLASKGNTSKAASVISKTWRRSPHPDLATAYAFARPGDSPKDRLKRVKDIAALAPHSIESPIAVALATIDAHDWQGARQALEPLLEKRLTQRVCTLMARIEGGQHGDRGRVREWLARAVNAPRDPAWTADGYVSDSWAPISPITGELDAFEWKVPVEPLDTKDRSLLLEELIPLAAETDPLLEASAASSVIIAAGSDVPGGIDDVTTKPPVAKSVVPVTPPAKTEEKSTEKTATSSKDDDGDGDGSDGKIVKPAHSGDSQGSRPSASTTVHSRSAGQAKVFVSPRAPDDPGTDSSGGEGSTGPGPVARFAAFPAKG